jgi:heme exporter protein D
MTSNSVSEFLAMGGYGLYVWGSYLMAALLMGAEAWLAQGRGAKALRNAAETRPNEGST